MRPCVHIFVIFFIACGMSVVRAEPSLTVPPVIDSTNLRPVKAATPAMGPPGRAQSGDGPMCREPLTVGEEEITEADRKLIEHQIASCSRKVARVADPWDILMLIRLERDIGVPDEARGILGAIYCVETAMRSGSSRGGPHRGDVRNGIALAHGPFQLHDWAEARVKCGLTAYGRDDLEASARCYWSRVMVRYAEVAECENSWRVAEARVANIRRYEWQGCKAQSRHWEELARWGPVP